MLNILSSVSKVPQWTNPKIALSKIDSNLVIFKIPCFVYGLNYIEHFTACQSFFKDFLTFPLGLFFLACLA
jgi:hypothetical protein